MIKKFFSILISILLINILTVNSAKLLDNTLLQFSFFTFDEQKLTANKIPGRIASKSNIILTVNSIGEGLNIEKTCDKLGNNCPYVIVTSGYVKTDTSIPTIYSGNVVSAKKSQETKGFNFSSYCKHEYAKETLDWDTYESALTYISTALGDLDDTRSGGFIQDGGNSILTVNIKKGQYVHVIDIDGPNFKPNTFRFNANGVKADDFVVIFNVKGKSITFKDCEFGSMNGYAHRVIWNMPDVTSLTMVSVRAYGSILAPQAYAQTNYGNVQGQMVVKNFDGPIQPEPDPKSCDDDFNGSCSSNDPFGIVSNFGAFVFGDFISEGSDVQSRIGCKGKLSVSSYSINQVIYGEGKNYRCDQSPLKEDFQYSVVAGTVEIQNAGLSNGGIAYTNSAKNVVDYIKNNIINNGCKFEKNSNIVDFTKEEERMIEISNKLATLKENGASTTTPKPTTTTTTKSTTTPKPTTTTTTKSTTTPKPTTTTTTKSTTTPKPTTTTTTKLTTTPKPTTTTTTKLTTTPKPTTTTTTTTTTITEEEEEEEEEITLPDDDTTTTEIYITGTIDSNPTDSYSEDEVVPPPPPPPNDGNPTFLRTAGITLGATALVAGSAMLLKYRRGIRPQPDPFQDPGNGLNNENPYGTITQDGDNVILSVNINYDLPVHVIDIDGPSFAPKTFKFNGNGVPSDNIVIVFNVKGEKITFTNCDFSSIKEYAHKVIWNMPNVTNLNINGVTVMGSILAPSANIQANNGNINGQVIVKNFEGTIHVLWNKFEGCLPVVPDIIPIATTTIPKTTTTTTIPTTTTTIKTITTSKSTTTTTTTIKTITTSKSTTTTTTKPTTTTTTKPTTTTTTKPTTTTTTKLTTTPKPTTTTTTKSTTTPKPTTTTTTKSTTTPKPTTTTTTKSTTTPKPTTTTTTKSTTTPKPTTTTTTNVWLNIFCVNQ
ncbi:hypothetical protein PIROE2DRAFT_60532 [Piromyces sp. E2]|nr:hypothetical protein PIROE2DRAFT_60532 [Piromyces sp. E2]|eukprot:OUM64618.1 hypothetical protein PIROE2DRAFT_60532 [Piromyces sp. E2]